MIWELGLDAENPEEAVHQARAIRRTPNELSGTQLLGNQDTCTSATVRSR
jgi:hypothetical protein